MQEKKKKKNQPLAPVLIVLVLHFLHPHRHPILGEHYIALFHLLSRIVAHFLDDTVGDVANSGEYEDHNKEYHQRDEACFGHFFFFSSLFFVRENSVGR